MMSPSSHWPKTRSAPGSAPRLQQPSCTMARPTSKPQIWPSRSGERPQPRYHNPTLRPLLECATSRTRREGLHTTTPCRTSRREGSRTCTSPSLNRAATRAEATKYNSAGLGNTTPCSRGWPEAHPPPPTGPPVPTLRSRLLRSGITGWKLEHMAVYLLVWMLRRFAKYSLFIQRSRQGCKVKHLKSYI